MFHQDPPAKLLPNHCCADLAQPAAHSSDGALTSGSGQPLPHFISLYPKPGARARASERASERASKRERKSERERDRVRARARARDSNNERESERASEKDHHQEREFRPCLGPLECAGLLPARYAVCDELCSLSKCLAEVCKRQ